MTLTFQICPVCSGRGMVHHGFYNTWPTYMSTSTADEQCRRCKGQGTIPAPTATGEPQPVRPDPTEDERYG